MSDALVALTFGLVFWFVLFPLAVVFVFALLDVLWREDIAIGKLGWARVVLALLGLSVLFYWLPRDFDSWVRKLPEWSDKPDSQATVKVQAGQSSRGFMPMDHQLHVGRRR